MDPWRKVIWALPSLGVAAAIFYMSSQEWVELPLSEISFNDLILHAAAYLVFGVTLLIAAHPWKAYHEEPIRSYALLLLIGMTYALSDEIHQSFVPNRDCSLADFLADSVGVALAMTGWLVYQTRVRQAFNRS